jgi:hypothetical protein
MGGLSLGKTGLHFFISVKSNLFRISSLELLTSGSSGLPALFGWGIKPLAALGGLG